MFRYQRDSYSNLTVDLSPPPYPIDYSKEDQRPWFDSEKVDIIKWTEKCFTLRERENCQYGGAIRIYSMPILRLIDGVEKFDKKYAKNSGTLKNLINQIKAKEKRGKEILKDCPELFDPLSELEIRIDEGDTSVNPAVYWAGPFEG